MPEGEEEEQETEQLFEKIMENFPNLAKEIDFQEVQEAQRVPKKLDLKEAYTILPSQKKLCRQEAAGKKYSTSWKARTYNLDYSLQQNNNLEWKGR